MNTVERKYTSKVDSKQQSSCLRRRAAKSQEGARQGRMIHESLKKAKGGLLCKKFKGQVAITRNLPLFTASGSFLSIRFQGLKQSRVRFNSGTALGPTGGI